MAKPIISFIFLSLLVTLVSSAHKFETDIITKLNAEIADSENFVISPFVIHQALAMLYLEKDKRRDFQLAKVLDITGRGTDDIISYFSDELKKANNENFMIENQIFYPENFNITPHMNKMSAALEVEVAKIHFSMDRKADTEKSIYEFDPKLWGKNKPTKNTKLVAVQGFFVEPIFKHKIESLTYKKFTLNKPNTKRVSFNTKMVYGTGNFESFIRDDVRGVTVPLSKSDLDLIIFIHFEGDNKGILKDIHKYLDIKMTKNNKTHLYIPIFKVDNTLDLSKALESFGIRKVFAGNIGKQRDITPPIFKQISALRVHVDPYLIESEYQADDDNKVIIVNQPFVFVIKDQETIYMAGRVETL